jgi:hypothetical protein
MAVLFSRRVPSTIELNGSFLLSLRPIYKHEKESMAEINGNISFRSEELGKLT